jgi:hypothetical protein
MIYFNGGFHSESFYDTNSLGDVATSRFSKLYCPEGEIVARSLAFSAVRSSLEL